MFFEKLFQCILYLAVATSLQATPVKDSVEKAKETSFQLADYVIKGDSTITFEPLTDALAEKVGSFKPDAMDPGFPKWLISFQEICGEPPYVIEQKRAFQSDPEVFEPLKLPAVVQILLAKRSKKPFQFVLSARGYLLGEEVRLRLRSKNKNVYKEITICPRPLVFRKQSGQLLARATLQPCPQALTRYQIDLSGVEEKEVVRWTSLSAGEKIETDLVGPTVMGTIPAVIGLSGGMNTVKMRLNDGSSYQWDLPWGSALFPYMKGTK